MTRLDNLVDLLKKAPDDVFIQPHNVPDPDAIAASFGLRYLLTTLYDPLHTLALAGAVLFILAVLQLAIFYLML